jgi:hypothetical protein
MPREQAERLLLRAYLRSFGPATAEDFSLWTSTTLTNAREIWRHAQANLASVNVEGWLVAILGDDLEALTQAEFERPRVLLLRTSILFSSGIKRENTL